MIRTPELCLGTVQFGLPYGITNKAGQVPELEVRNILELAAKSGISLLDTAQAYGTAETVLGRCWPTDSSRRLISKLPAGAVKQSWEINLMTSLQRLRTTKLDAFLLHRSSDLITPDGKELLNWLEGLRDRGLVERIGVSIYDGSELERLPLDRLQVVQLPLSVYDQRLIHDGSVDRLQDLGIAVHARSVFLQGLLLQSPHQWPANLSAPLREHHAEWLEHLHQWGISPLAGALSFIRSCGAVEAALCGVVSRKELAQVLKAWNDLGATYPEASMNWSWDNEIDLDPRRWPTQ